MPYDHDESQWPIVLCRPSGNSTDEDIVTYIAAHGAALRRGPHVTIVDARGGQSMEAKHRRQITDWIKANAAELRLNRLGAAFVSDSVVVRGILTALYWVAPPPYPYQIFKTMNEALAWSHARMTAPKRAAG
jgi:hypothetical protein